MSAGNLKWLPNGMGDGRGVGTDVWPLERQVDTLIDLWTPQQIHACLEAFRMVLAQAERVRRGLKTEPWFMTRYAICLNSAGAAALGDSCKFAPYHAMALFSPSWSHFSGNPVYPVEFGTSGGYWVGRQLSLRIDLLRHLIQALELAESAIENRAKGADVASAEGENNE